MNNANLPVGMLVSDFASFVGAQRDVELTRLREVEGWLTEEAIELTRRFVQLQHTLQSPTGVLELGVFRGKYLALLAAIHARTGVPIVGVDGFLAKLGERLQPEWQALAERLIRDNIRMVAGDGQFVGVVNSLTRDLDVEALRRLCPAGYSFISVDAGHEAEDLLTDLKIAMASATPGAVIAVDDMFNPLVPGVAEGVCSFFQQNPSCLFRPFAIGGNKVFLCPAEHHATYLRYSRWIMSEVDIPFLCKSLIVAEENARNDFVPRLFGDEVAIFVWG